VQGSHPAASVELPDLSAAMFVQSNESGIIAGYYAMFPQSFKCIDGAACSRLPFDVPRAV
jgi:hypothetical protein